MSGSSHSQGVPAITFHPWATVSSFFFLNPFLFIYVGKKMLRNMAQEIGANFYKVHGKKVKVKNPHFAI